jgi:hypothetical protein
MHFKPTTLLSLRYCVNLVAKLTYFQKLQAKLMLASFMTQPSPHQLE